MSFCPANIDTLTRRWDYSDVDNIYLFAAFI